MKEFYATLIISSPEEEQTIKFLVEAESLDKAVENVKADLDIE